MNIASFGKNTLFYATGMIIIRFTTFLLIPLYTNFLSIEEYGLLATLLFTTEIIITINDVGMRSAFMRFFSEFDKKGKFSELFGSSVLLNIIAGIILFIIASLIPDNFLADLFNTKLIKNVITLTILVGISKTLNLNILSYFRVKNLGASYMTISVLTSLLLVLATWLTLVVNEMGIIGILWAQILTFGGSWLLILLWIIIKNGFSPKPSTILMLSKFGYPLIFSTSGVILLTTMGNYFLGVFRNLEEVAILSIAYKVASISVMVLIGPFQLAFEPYIFNNKDNPNLKQIISKSITYISISFLIIGIGILFAFKYLIHFIGSSEYLESYPLVYLLLPAFLFTALNYIGQSMIHLNNKTKTTGLVSLLVTICSIFISYFSTQYFGIYGTILGIVFWLITSGILILSFGNKEFPIKIEYKRLFIILSLGFFLFISMYILSFLGNFIFLLSVVTLLIISGYALIKFNFFEKSEIKILQNVLDLVINKFRVHKN